MKKLLSTMTLACVLAASMAAFAQDHHHSPEPGEQADKMRADIEARGLTQILQRFERAITTAAVWAANPGAAREDVLATWRQLVALQGSDGRFERNGHQRGRLAI